MGGPRPRVTFVTYEASRTGSPILLLRLLRWLHANAALDLEVICWRGGPLVASFRELGDVRVLGRSDGRSVAETAVLGVQEIGLHRVGRRLEQARLAIDLRRRPPSDLLFLNGVPSFVALPHLRTDSVPVVAQIHELEFALSRSLPPGEGGLLHQADRYLPVAQAVADNLVHHHGIGRDRMAVIRGFVDPAAAGSPAAGTSTELRRRLGIPPDAAVVGAVGDMIWRKGPDLFLQTAAAVRALRGERVHFVWVGGRPGHGTYAEVDHDRVARGLDDCVHLVGEQAAMADWYRLFDLFVLPSREDPFPLVMLEAAQSSVPIVAFDAGGAREFLGGDREVGIIVPALDTAAMASAVDSLLDDDNRRAGLARRAAQRVESDHLTAVQAPRVLAEIEALL